MCEGKHDGTLQREDERNRSRMREASYTVFHSIELQVLG